MSLRDFAKKVAAITPSIHIMLIRRMPKMLAKGKMTFPQTVIMDILRARKICKMGDLSKALGVTKSAVTGITNRLIKAGLLKRINSRVDRRIINIQLTSKGAKLAREFGNYKLGLLQDLFSNINAKERLQYLRILGKLHRNILRRKKSNPYG